MHKSSPDGAGSSADGRESSLDGTGPSPDGEGSATGPDPSTIDVGGRDLAYAEYGDPAGVPVFAFHGVLGSRLTWALFDDPARAAGIRLVAPERPGFGHSDFQRRRRLLDWPADVRALASHLDVDRFGVVGFSAGGPHAVACAHALPDRVRGVALASTVTPPATRDSADPFNEALLSATRYVPGFSQVAFGTAAWLARYSRAQFRASIVSTCAAPDRALFDEPVGEHLVTDAAEAFRQGGRGPAHDLPLVGNAWGFDDRALDSGVTLFHGSADATVRVDLARAFADRLPDATLSLCDAAHYSTLLHERESILAAATGA